LGLPEIGWCAAVLLLAAGAARAAEGDWFANSGARYWVDRSSRSLPARGCDGFPLATLKLVKGRAAEVCVGLRAGADGVTEAYWRVADGRGVSATSMVPAVR